MHGLSVLFHYIVGDINKVVDRTDAVCGKASLHPFGRRSDLDIFYHSRRVSGAEIRIFYRNLDVVGSVLPVSCCLHNRRTEFPAESGCRLSGDSDHAVAVHTVGCDLILKDNIVQAERFDGALSDFCVFRENINTVFRSFRIHFSGASKLFDGAHHTAGFHAAELSFLDQDSSGSFLAVVASRHTAAVQNDRNLVSLFYIGSSGYDLYSLCSDIHLADDQFVRVGMSLYLHDLSDDDFIQIRVQLFIPFHLRSGKRHGVCVFLGCHIQIRHIHFDPGH